VRVGVGRYTELVSGQNIIKVVQVVTLIYTLVHTQIRTHKRIHTHLDRTEHHQFDACRPPHISVEQTIERRREERRENGSEIEPRRSRKGV
jgi:hypothetical protein